MKLVKEYRCDDRTPSDDEIRECLEIVKEEDCIINLKWYVQYSGWYKLSIDKDMTFEDCKDKLPKRYGV